MGYPGDQGNPGGVPWERREPWAPDAERSGGAPRGDDGWTPQGGGHTGGQPVVGPASRMDGPPHDDRFDDPGAATRHAPPSAFGAEPPEGLPVAGRAAWQQQGGAYDDPGPYDGGRYEGPPDEGFTDRGDDAPRRSRRLPLVIAGAAVAGLVLMGAGYAGSSMLQDDEKKPAPQAAPAAETPEPSASPKPSVSPLDPVKLKSRATDPKPMTLAEAFGKATYTAGGQKYTRTAWKSGSCTGAVTGASFAAAVKKAGCSQTLRATYARKDGKLVGTVGVLNLKTEKGAKYAERAAAAQNAYLRPVPGGGHSRTIGKGEALGTAQARGHYLVMTWVQRPDGKKIPAAHHKTVATFGQQMIKGSNLGFALAYRETEGVPFKN
ncbi:hypothetical protein [Actinomadura flavalba]|uniref:hypothetical protein n=1 Tax=Actinomadura flavalba TaxID=1120938 RepID=UPI00036C060F|nr:hypothetical protein [Actinomadura flavalba]